jgi:hypothetical protein
MTQNGTSLGHLRASTAPRREGNAHADPTRKQRRIKGRFYCATQFATIAFHVRLAMTTEPIAFG